MFAGVYVHTFSDVGWLAPIFTDLDAPHDLLRVGLANTYCTFELSCHVPGNSGDPPKKYLILRKIQPTTTADS
jgi:hypothetical protein